MAPEMRVRKLLFKLGYRYRLHNKVLPGHPDIIFTRLRRAIFVNGCFWHQHESPSCRITRIPKSNLDYWLPKLKRTVERDRQNLKALSRLKWISLVIWECEVSDTERLIRRLIRFMRA